MVKRIEIFIKSRELFLADLCVFLALFSKQCLVLCQNCCHYDELINHLQVVLRVVSLFVSFFFHNTIIDNLFVYF